MNNDSAFQYPGVFDKTREELLLSLDTGAGSGGPLIPEDLNPTIVELVRWLSPLTAMVKVERANGLTHQFNQRTVLPAAAFEGENALTAQSNSTYVRATVELKVIRSKGSVTGLLQAASQKFTNALKKEIEGAAKAMARLIEFGLLWGNTTDAYQYNGADAVITTNRIDWNAVASLGLLDDMLDRVENAGAAMDPKCFIMSPQMNSKVSGLQTQIRKSVNVGQIEFPGGLIMNTYRDVPILRSSYCRPTGTMGAITAADSGVAGSLVAATAYNWRVAPVTIYGEQIASPSTAHTTGGGITSVLVSFAGYAGALLYKVYRTIGAGAAGTEKLVAVIPSLLYDGNGTVVGLVASYNDGVADASLGADSPYDAAGGGNDVMETIFLIDLDLDNSLGIYGLLNMQGDPVADLIQFLPLARVKDSEDFLLVSYHAPAWKAERFSALARRVRTF